MTFTTLHRTKSFNPSIGILVVRTGFTLPSPTRRRCFNPSIGILVVRTGQGRLIQILGEAGFNPSIGILVVRTGVNNAASRLRCLFQSLDRDSGCSDLHPADHLPIVGEVSIPRSGFWLFGPAKTRGGDDEERSFNPSIGILVVRTGGTWSATPSGGEFQSLDRDSGCSDGPTSVIMYLVEDSFNPSIGILVVRTCA